MKIDVLGTEYEILVQNDNPKMKDSDGFCEWVSKKIIITDSYRNDEDVLENIDDYKADPKNKAVIDSYLDDLIITLIQHRMSF
jgi:hypothetical protein